MALMNLNLLLLLLGLGVPVSSAVSLQKRIVGGENCKDDERRYHVKIVGESKTATYFCGGSLISDEWVLTAAHCWKSEPGWTITAYVGIHPHSVKTETYTITDHVIYKSFTNLKHDIMLLKLPKKTTIQPIELADCISPLNVGTELQVAGFGSTVSKAGDDEPGDLQCAKIPIVKREIMKDALEKMDLYDEYKYQHWSCAKSSTKDTSPGDSGGGWVFGERLYGVHSFTGDPKTSCSEPAGFMNVCSYRKWINDIIKPKPSKSAG